MVKIYRPFSDTWTIPKETLEELKHKKLKSENYISNSINVFPQIPSSLNMGYLCEGRGSFYFEFYIFDLNPKANITISVKSDNLKINFKNIVFRSPTFYLPSDILDPDKNFIADGKCVIEISGMFITKRDEHPSIPRINILTDELWKNREKDFDIVVINEEKNEEKIQTHKDVLIAQSPYFEGMFRSGLEEAVTNTLKIIDFDFKTVEIAVAFFYGHDLPNFVNYDNIMELYRFADKYFIDNLIDYITTFISYRLTPSNVSKNANFANVYNFSKFEQKCDDFITVCKENEILIDELDDYE